jgi:hypothetical protein
LYEPGGSFQEIVVSAGVLSARTESLTTAGGGSGEPPQLPAVHTSAAVHWFPSLHDVPSGTCGFVHVPVPVLQIPATWHWSLAKQVTGFDPAHVPD